MKSPMLYGMGMLLLLVALHSCHVTPTPPVVASPTPNTVAHFDYGDFQDAKSPDMSTPMPKFENTPPRGGTPVIDGPEAVEDAAGETAFGDVPEAEEEEKKPVASTPPKYNRDKPTAVPEPTEEPLAFAEAPKARPVSAGPTAASQEWINNVFPVMANNGQTCSAVAISNNTLLTVYHVPRVGGVRVGINNQWVPAQVQYIQNPDDGFRDGSLLYVQNGRLPVMNVRAPQYYEPVTIYGFRSKQAQRGFISANRAVSILPENQGVDMGDSGGAVVADDGCLVGLISGFEDTNRYLGTQPNKRVVYITRADLFLPHIQRQQPMRTPMQGTPPGQDAPPQPVNASPPSAFNSTPPASGVDQPSAFDPPVVNQQVQQPGLKLFQFSTPDCGNPNCPVHGKNRAMFGSPDCGNPNCPVHGKKQQLFSFNASTPDCGNPNCPIHGNKQFQSQAPVQQYQYQYQVPMQYQLFQTRPQKVRLRIN